ncbi:MAG: crotonobetainyl-CoA--carnitine CoA-transferase, partial [Dehalococcoidia bacterium]|nr:crotonobetainyl-CoA--carnitine CoA-transferase [Dehalococcoidia bacterium]
MTERKIEVTSNTSDQERAFEREFARCFAERPIPDDQILQNLGLFLSSKNLSRILFMHHLYQQTISVPGIVMDFGTRWGQNLALFAAYRGMYDPFHRHRKLVGFDTFAGFPGFAPQDGTGALIDIGSRSVPENYVEYLTRVMECQEGVNPLAHIRKFELVEGNACLTLPKYLEDNPETIVALAYFDFDLY